MFSLFNGPAWQLIVHADLATKLVLVSLFLLSVVCVAGVIFKWFELGLEEKNTYDLLQKVRAAKDVEAALEVSKQFHGGIGGKLVHGMFSELNRHVESGGSLSGSDFEDLADHADQLVIAHEAEASRFLPVLGTSAAVSPLVGLFGTVWGLICAFTSISQQKSADIVVIAPGIAGALLTTLAGLAVAIPALIFYHFLSGKVRSVERNLYAISDRTLMLIRRRFVREG
ncbi:MotA/TolQ/ExbB proton channel family protein [bacterium]|jgi:biopolymer transport protein TolQ|nr:MotA/TolQ/ExbB proton channel family protein [bacterium]